MVSPLGFGEEADSASVAGSSLLLKKQTPREEEGKKPTTGFVLEKLLPLDVVDCVTHRGLIDGIQHHLWALTPDSFVHTHCVYLKTQCPGSAADKYSPWKEVKWIVLREPGFCFQRPLSGLPCKGLPTL